MKSYTTQSWAAFSETNQKGLNTARDIEATVCGRFKVGVACNCFREVLFRFEIEKYLGDPSN